MSARAGLLAVAWLVTGACGNEPPAQPTPPPSAPDPGPAPQPLPPTLPLPATTFVFERLVAGGAGPVSHLIAYDVVSRSERLISRLDDDAGGGTLTGGFALSPDRRWLAVATRAFRTTAEDLSQHFSPMPAVWLVSVDGARTQRLTAAFPGEPGGNACASATERADCPQGQACIANRCRSPGLTVTVDDPVFSPDGSVIYFDYGRYWDDPAAPQGRAGSTRVAALTISGIAMQQQPMDCLAYSEVAPHPRGGTLLVRHASCTGSAAEGFYQWTIQPLQARRRLIAPAGFDFTFTLPTWFPDGSGAAFITQGVRRGIHVWDATTGALAALDRPPGDDVDAENVTVSPDGQFLVVELSPHELHLVDRNTGAWTKLPIAGPAARPRW